MLWRLQHTSFCREWIHDCTMYIGSRQGLGCGGVLKLSNNQCGILSNDRLFACCLPQLLPAGSRFGWIRIPCPTLGPIITPINTFPYSSYTTTFNQRLTAAIASPSSLLLSICAGGYLKSVLRCEPSTSQS